MISILVYIYRISFESPDRLLAQFLSAQAIGAEGLLFPSRAGQIGTMSPPLRRFFVAVLPRR